MPRRVQLLSQSAIEFIKFVWVPKRVQLLSQSAIEFIKLRQWLCAVERSVLVILGRVGAAFQRVGAAFQRVGAGIVESVAFKPIIQFAIVVECFVRRMPRGSI